MTRARFVASTALQRSSGALRDLDNEALRKIVYSLLREWAEHISVSRRGAFVDFDVRAVGPLSLGLRLRFRLFFEAPSRENLVELVGEATARSLQPIAITPHGSPQAPPGVTVIGELDLERLAAQSAVVTSAADGARIVDRDALRELEDHSDPRIALLNGLLWLRPLSRDRIPPALRWTGTPAHELFEQCFFLSFVSTFSATGVRWGTRERGRPFPDGRLTLPGLRAVILYDCKASRGGYEMSYRDLTGFTDYINDPVEKGWTWSSARRHYFVVVSSQYIDSGRGSLFERRKASLARKAQGARLVWLRAPDVARFGLALERAHVTYAHRRLVRWRRLFDRGNLNWPDFREELAVLSSHGYSFGDS